jgi:hypothetical protein
MGTASIPTGPSLARTIYAGPLLPCSGGFNPPSCLLVAWPRSPWRFLTLQGHADTEKDWALRGCEWQLKLIPTFFAGKRVKEAAKIPGLRHRSVTAIRVLSLASISLLREPDELFAGFNPGLRYRRTLPAFLSSSCCYRLPARRSPTKRDAGRSPACPESRLTPRLSSGCPERKSKGKNAMAPRLRVGIEWVAALEAVSKPISTPLDSMAYRSYS